MFRLKGNRFRQTAIQHKIRNFLLREQSREFLIFLFFFIISGGFWLLQTLKDDYEADLSFPLRMQGVPREVVLTSPLPSTLHVRVRDKGTTLISYMLSRQFYPITVDFDAYKGKGNHVRILSKELEKRISSQLDASSVLLAMDPDTLEYIYSCGEAQKMPVRLSGVVSPSPLYYLTDTVCTPDSVMVYAPASLIDSISCAFTEEVNWTGLSDTLRARLPLRPIKGVKYVPEQVEVMLPVDIITEKTLEVPVTGVGFPSDKVLRTFPSKVKVTFQVGLNRFRKIQADQFVIEVPYDDLMRCTADKYRLRLAAKPQGVSHIRISPQEVEYLIEQIQYYD